MSVLQALPQHGALPYFMYNSDLLGAAQPPPAHVRLAPLQFAAHPGLSFRHTTIRHYFVIMAFVIECERMGSYGMDPFSHTR